MSKEISSEEIAALLARESMSKEMTREEAIEELSILFNKYQDGNIGDALDMAMTVLEQEPCEDAISRQAVLDIIEDRIKNGLPQNVAISQYYHTEVKKLSSVNPEPKIGYWIYYRNEKGDYINKCSTCGQDCGVGYPYNFCPNCGTKMESEV